MLSINGQPVHVTMFPDRTSQVWHLPSSTVEELKSLSKPCEITWVFDNEGELVQIVQLKALLDSFKVESGLHMPYLPYGRQDKEVSNDTTFALRALAHVINSLEFKYVSVLDPHSMVSAELIKRLWVYYPFEEVRAATKIVSADLLCYPDKGASSKYAKVYETLYLPQLYGEKVRDQKTGDITSYSVAGDPSGKRVLIVDDICDGGMTFKILAKDLISKGAKSVSLFVTHGIFSKGLDTLRHDGIEKIFTHKGEATDQDGPITYRRA